MDNKAQSDINYWSLKIQETQKEIHNLTKDPSGLVTRNLNYTERYRLRDLVMELKVFSDLLQSSIDYLFLIDSRKPSRLKRLLKK